MLAFHVCVHARPAEATPSAARAVDSSQLATLDVRVSELPPLPVSFEDAAAALNQLPRMYCEPDGSFVWVSRAGEPAWQVDGVLYDRAGRLLFVDLKGTCPDQEFDRLLVAFGWPATSVIFQLVRAAAFVAEADFRRWAAEEWQQLQKTGNH